MIALAQCTTCTGPAVDPDRARTGTCSKVCKRLVARAQARDALADEALGRDLMLARIDGRGRWQAAYERAARSLPRLLGHLPEHLHPDDDHELPYALDDLYRVVGFASEHGVFRLHAGSVWRYLDDDGRERVEEYRDAERRAIYDGRDPGHPDPTMN